MKVDYCDSVADNGDNDGDGNGGDDGDEHKVPSSKELELWNAHNAASIDFTTNPRP